METQRKKWDLWPMIVGTIAAIGIIGSNSTGGITKTTREPATTTSASAAAGTNATAGTSASAGASLPAQPGPGVGPTGSSPSATAGAQAIQIVESPSSVKAGDQAAIRITGQPGVTYDIVVAIGRESGGVSGMEPKQADAEGRVSWQWRVPILSSRGTYTVTITGGGQQATSSFTVS